MQRLLVLSSILLSVISLFAQKSEELIPRDAATTFTINNISLLKKISMDDLVQYEFMEEVQSELFNGSTHGKTIKDAGFDFNQRINAFFGQTHKYDISGFTFGVSDEKALLQIFDNFDLIASRIPNVKVYRNDLNYLFFSGSSALIIRVEPSVTLVKEITDSIWLEKGYGFYIPDDWGVDSLAEGNFDDVIEDELADSSFYGSDEMADMDVLNKNYWELRDSIRYEFQQLFIQQISTELFVDKHSLYSDYVDFSAQLMKTADGVFYLDNSRNLSNNKGMWQFQNIFPALFADAEVLYEGNIITGELNIVKNQIVVDVRAKYGEQLGEIYSNITKTKFNTTFTKYIHKDALAYLTYNVNLKNGYHASFDIIMDLIRNEENQKVLSNVLLAELINEFVDVDNIFEVYQGSMFASLNGYKKIKVNRIDYKYDEETFEYSETEVEEDQDIPNLTIGLKTNKQEFLTRIARLLAKTRPDIIKHEGYYEIQNAVLNTIPAYFAVVNDLVLVTTDENLFATHMNGYAKSEQIKPSKAKKSVFTYAYIDLDNALKKLPREVLNERQNEVIGTLINKSGTVELKTVKTSKKEAQFQLNYTLNEDIENNGKYLLDLINSLYTFTK